MNHFTGWSDNCPASTYLEISPLVANRSGATWKSLPLALKWSHLRATQKEKGRDRVWSASFRIGLFLHSVEYSMLFFPPVVGTAQHRCPQQNKSRLAGSKKPVKQDLVIRWPVKGQWLVGEIFRQLLPAPRDNACSSFSGSLRRNCSSQRPLNHKRHFGQAKNGNLILWQFDLFLLKS